jgi:WD40 repeat protein
VPSGTASSDIFDSGIQIYRLGYPHFEQIGALALLVSKMSGLFGSSSTNTANTLGDLSKDIQLNQAPEDSISDLAFSPQSEHLAVSSWDKKVRIYEVNESGGEGKALFEHEGPVLSCHWSPVSSLLLSSYMKVN